MGRPVVHFELWSKDPETLSTFYSEALGWNIRHIAEMDYRLVDAEEGGIGGGIMTPKEGPWPSDMTFYIDVDDLDAYRQRVERAGGTILVPRQDVPGVGSFCLFKDPDGRVLGLWQQGESG